MIVFGMGMTRSCRNRLVATQCMATPWLRQLAAITAPDQLEPRPGRGDGADLGVRQSLLGDELDYLVEGRSSSAMLLCQAALAGVLVGPRWSGRDPGAFTSSPVAGRPILG
jgi:hypothetical protein